MSNLIIFEASLYLLLYILVSGQFLLAATKLGQGNVFTGVCDSVLRGVCLPQCTPSWACTPPGLVPPRQVPPGQVHPPPARYTPGQVPPEVHPLGRYTLQAGTPPSRYPPGQVHPLCRYTHHQEEYSGGQRAAGTHPTGMHSCS